MKWNLTDIKLSHWTLVLFAWLLNIAISFIAQVVNFYYFNSDQLTIPFIEDWTIIEEFVLVVAVAPIVETFIYQWAIIEAISRLLKNQTNKYTIGIGISSICFGLAHGYNLFYMLSSGIIGIVLAGSYLIAKTKFSFPFWTVALIHSLQNLLTFILKNSLGN